MLRWRFCVNNSTFTLLHPPVTSVLQHVKIFLKSCHASEWKTEYSRASVQTTWWAEVAPGVINSLLKSSCVNMLISLIRIRRWGNCDLKAYLGSTMPVELWPPQTCKQIQWPGNTQHPDTNVLNESLGILCVCVGGWRGGRGIYNQKQLKQGELLNPKWWMREVICVSVYSATPWICWVVSFRCFLRFLVLRIWHPCRSWVRSATLHCQIRILI